MNRAVIVSFPSPLALRAAARLRLALAGSALVHLLGMGMLLPETLPGSVRGNWRPAPITVRVELLPSPAPPAPAIARHKETAKPEGTQHAVGNVAGKRAAPRGRPVDRRESMALPRVADPMVYTARDLDSFPRPLLPMDIGRLLDRAGGPAPGFRLELLIDEHGTVNEVTFASPVTAGVLERELRAAIAGTAFVPARKDGRAVKSRVVLSVDFGQEKNARGKSE